ncbi:MAG: Transcriptional regulatory protein SrrA [Firmicutes bacterium ADurb.Bin300]|nr:MAG: Transcriptional regulatory protein SrrA [Firmicutes bacterium ADurb.Bin300]HOD02326.1 response regulator transcription factor [Clostridiales bacterium]
MAKVLIADDEQLMRRLIADFLKKDGHEVYEAQDGEEALKLFKSVFGMDIVILDIMMPKLDGWEVCRKIREVSDIPIMLVSARSQDFDQIMGFESGADEYVTKPFSPAVLAKRVQVLLSRHKSGKGEKSNSREIIVLDNITLNTAAHEVYLDGNPVELTLKEYKILNMLMSSIGRVYSRDHLLDEIWGMDYFGDIRTVDSHVARLRTKLGKWGSDKIKTVYGIGYKIEVDA